MVDVGPSDTVVEEAASLSGWTDLIRERFVPLHIRPHDSHDVRGLVRSRHIAHLQASTVRSVPMTFDRARRQAAAAEADLLAVGLIEQGTGYLEQDGRRCSVSDGAFAVYDTARPFRWSLDGPWMMHVYTWPRAGVPVTDRELEQLTARAVDPTCANQIRGDVELYYPEIKEWSDERVLAFRKWICPIRNGSGKPAASEVLQQRYDVSNSVAYELMDAAC